MKVFISQPMSGLTTEEVVKARDRAIRIIKNRYPNEEIHVIENYIHDLPEGSHPLEYLGRDILIMKDADLVFFVHGHHAARGCRIEWSVANEYGLKIPLFKTRKDRVKSIPDGKCVITSITAFRITLLMQWCGINYIRRNFSRKFVSPLEKSTKTRQLFTNYTMTQKRSE